MSPGRQQAHLWREAVTGKSLGRQQWQPPARDEPAQTAVDKMLTAAPSPLATLTLRELVMPLCLPEERGFFHDLKLFSTVAVILPFPVANVCAFGFSIISLVQCPFPYTEWSLGA